MIGFLFNAALVIGLLAFIVFMIISLVALIVCGYQALKELKEDEW